MLSNNIIPDWELTETAETLYNFRNAMDIEGIKSILWQLANHQDKISFKAGIVEVAEWVETHSIGVFDGRMERQYEQVSIDIELKEWQTKLKEWGL